MRCVSSPRRLKSSLNAIFFFFFTVAFLQEALDLEDVLPDLLEPRVDVHQRNHDRARTRTGHAL